MGKFLIVSKEDRLEEYLFLANEYGVALEINDFFEPDVLDNQEVKRRIVDKYIATGIANECTMHGAFLDIAVFSKDSKIREASIFRMKQSMEIANEIGVTAVVFHTNYNPDLSENAYVKDFVESTTQVIDGLLMEYPHINIYLENMFDRTPEILERIATNLKSYKNFGVCLDWAHVNVYGEDMDMWAVKLAPFVKHIHINDNDLQRDLHLAVGNGKIDWQHFAWCYKEYFEGSSVLIETNEPENQRKSLEFLKGYFVIGG